MKTAIKVITLFFISVLAIYFLYNNNILDLNSLKNAFYEHKKLILLIAILQVINCFLMTARYFSILKIFKVKTDFHNVTAATFVSNGLGQWLPGSMAFIEVIRIGLMLGADKYNFLNKKEKKLEGDKEINSNSFLVEKNLNELSLKSKLLAISIMDRIIGILVMLGFGIIFLLKEIIFMKNTIHLELIFYFSFSIFLFLFLVALPFISRILFIRKLITRIERILITPIKAKLIKKVLKKCFEEINSLLDAIALGSKKIASFGVPIIFSCFSVLSLVFSFYFSAKAISANLPLQVIFAVLPMLSLASLIPMGLAGMGGMQIVSVLLFSIFAVSSNTASSAQLLQTAVNLLSISCVGLFFARLSAKQIHAIIQAKKNANLLAKRNMSDITDI
ncbi:lysylphosphatidylglycerol synthase transmembrane domain-containing protein [Pigmentibacter sp. JX0631]|uniref:lysylphosphatidylglycerol synthase transmembrane domain-containing protein n=1 Tax=Pigmentibacter sp. JX0631 TaxID=2976982 RepID=UPI0024698933|nr:lysylphosphatidylglycerol synthase transmembrane domain-containing protein [Pigmentibacter sp. JX0631]WGL61488.1 lysylphosphatidylglycerol synthase transmembrane domain-containing protein [Pigmentibacter sp. JX0631]